MFSGSKFPHEKRKTGDDAIIASQCPIRSKIKENMLLLILLCKYNHNAYQQAVK